MSKINLAENLRKKGYTVLNFSAQKVEPPRMEIVKTKDYVFFSDGNCFPDELVELLNNSTLHNSIVVSNVQETMGNDLIFDNTELEEATRTYLDGIDYNSLVEKIAYDLHVFGGFYLEIIRGKDKVYVSDINHIPYEKIRANKMEDGEIKKYWYCEDWDQFRRKEYTPVEIPVYGSGEVREIYAYKRYSPKQYYYPLPTYVGAMKYIQIEAEIANFHLSNILNGLNPGLVVFMKDSNTLTEDEKIEVERQIKKKFEGSDNTGKMILMIGEEAPTVTQLTVSDLDKQFIALNDMILQNILSAHRITNPLLVGIKTPGELGGNAELMNAYNLYFKKVISPAQKVIEDTLNEFLSINKLSSIEIDNEAILDTQFSEQTLSTILTVDELRQMINYPPKGEVEQIMEKETFAAPSYIDRSTFDQATPNDLESMYMWVVGGSDEVCPACLFNEGRIKSLKRWLEYGIPGVMNNYTNLNGLTTDYKTRQTEMGESWTPRPTDYPSYCQENCACKLTKITD